MKRGFIAVLAAITLSVALCPVSTGAVETEDQTGDLIDNQNEEDGEMEEGEQTTVIESDTGDDSEGDGGSEGETASPEGSSNEASGSSSSGNSGGSAQTGSASDSSLSRLGISPGTLVPAFSPDIYSYTVDVGADVKAVSVPATPNSSKAVIASVTGAKSLAPGANTVKVVVEAQNGSTSTYTITVNCGTSTTSAPQTGAAEDHEGEQVPAIEGEIIDGDAEAGNVSVEPDTKETKQTDSKVAFDGNGYLIYEGNAYIPSDLVPQGEFVSLEKYNLLYEQVQSSKTKSTRALLVLVLVILALLIVILNLVLKLRDMKQDAKLGLLGYDSTDSDRPIRTREEKKQAKKAKPAKAPVKKAAAGEDAMDSTRIPDVKLDDFKKIKKDASDIEILDLNDL